MASREPVTNLSVNLLIKPGWPYFTNDISNFFLSNKKLIQPGKTIGNDLIFDRESIFLEIIPLNNVIGESILTLTETLSKSNFVFNPCILLLNFQVPNSIFRTFNEAINLGENKNINRTFLSLNRLNIKKNGLHTRKEMKPNIYAKNTLYNLNTLSNSIIGCDSSFKTFLPPDLQTEIQQTLWVTKMVVKNKKSRYEPSLSKSSFRFAAKSEANKTFLRMNASQIKETKELSTHFTSFKTIPTTKKKLVSKDWVKTQNSGNISIEKHLPFVFYKSLRAQAGFLKKENTKFLILIRTASEYKLFKDSDYKKEIHKIANQKQNTLNSGLSFQTEGYASGNSFKSNKIPLEKKQLMLMKGKDNKQGKASPSLSSTYSRATPLPGMETGPGFLPSISSAHGKIKKEGKPFCENNFLKKENDDGVNPFFSFNSQKMVKKKEAARH